MLYVLRTILISMLLGMSCPAIQACNAPQEIFEAAIQGNIHALRDLIQQGIAPDVTDENGRTPLIHAIMHNKLNVVTFLLKKYPQCAHHMPDLDQETPLDYAEKYKGVESEGLEIVLLIREMQQKAMMARYIEGPQTLEGLPLFPKKTEAEKPKKYTINLSDLEDL